MTMFILRWTILCLLTLPVWAADEELPDTTADIQEESTPASGALEDEEAANTENTEGQTPSRQNPITYVTLDKAKQRRKEVIQHLKTFQRKDEIIEINGKNGPTAGLYLPENTGKPQGGVLILHDIAQHAQWPNTVTPIREYLPDYGWNTLSIFFDQYIKKPRPIIPPVQVSSANETENTDNTPEEALVDSTEDTNTQDPQAPEDTSETAPPLDDTQDTPDTDALGDIANNLDEIPEFEPQIDPETLKQPAIPIEETFVENMVLSVEQGLNKLNELGQFNIVIIANGLSANWAAKLLEERLTENNKGYALILIDAKSSQYPLIDLDESLSKLDIPMLDIVTDQSVQNQYNIKKRKGTMLRNQNTQYMQLFLPAIKPDLTQTDNIISRRIRGWLLTHAAGEEIAVKQKGNY